MRHERLYLADILEAADHIASLVAECGPSVFEESELARSAIVQKLSVIGEAAARVSAPLKARYPLVPWEKVLAFRNILIHAYFGVDWDIVWHAATKDSPELRRQISAILADCSEEGA